TDYASRGGTQMANSPSTLGNTRRRVGPGNLTPSPCRVEGSSFIFRTARRFLVFLRHPPQHSRNTWSTSRTEALNYGSIRLREGAMERRGLYFLKDIV